MHRLLLLAILPAVALATGLDFPEEEELRDEQGRRCMPLPECEGLMYLIRRVRESDDIPGMSRQDVFKTARKMMCGHDGHTPKVFCSDPEEDDEEDDEEEEEEYYEDLAAPRSGGGIFDLANDVECEGVLKLHHLSKEGDGDVKTSVYKRQRYPHLRRLKQRLVFGSQVDGGCCWKLSESKSFRGQSQRLGLGAVASPDLQPRSARKTPCR